MEESKTMEELELEDLDEDTAPAFIVDDDMKADWCIRKIKEIQEDTERWRQFYTERMKAVEESNMFRVAHMKQLLVPYLQTVPLKETKTQRKYGLPSGDLIIKKEHTKVEHDDVVLLEWLKQNATEFIKTKEAVDWKSLKDQLFEDGGEYFLRDTGEKVPGVTDTLVHAEFEVKVKGA